LPNFGIWHWKYWRIFQNLRE